MKYFYIHPFKPQYFFPKSFKKHEVFVSFFKPYSFTGKISWWIFRTFGLYRIWFGKTNIETFIPEKEIRKIIGLKSLMAFNTGTWGPEQKITGVGWEKNVYFFIKYAQTPLALKNVVNEHNVLRQLSHLGFVPQVKGFYQDEKRVLLKTDVLTGNRLGNVPLNQKILNCLFILAKESTILEPNSSSTVKISFAHGDFCPWNMMEKNGRILLFDWEMGGNYPLGYDLFTFLFQTNFLLIPEKPTQSILSENKKMIDQYYNQFNISDWKNYLVAFSKLKVGSESKKGRKGMFSQYKLLLSYAEKA